MELKTILREIAAYERTYKKWEGRAEKVIKRYAGETIKNNSAQFNILWSNVETLIPAVFARVPQPEVTRRYKDKDPVGRVASLILERCLEYEVQHYDDYKASMTLAVKDRFLPGRGVCWVRYEPKFQDEQVQVSDDAEERVETIDYECAPVDYVHWKDFGHSCARTWEEVKLVWRKVYMSREELAERFGESVANNTPLDQSASEMTTRDEQQRQVPKATVYEVWSKDEGKVIWLTKGREKSLDVRDDPLGLREFWPCPKPLFATTTTDSIVPIPDFTIYQDQADELDLICQRIDGLVRALKVTGVYDASQTSLRRLLDEGTNGVMIPVDSWSVFSERGGVKGMMEMVPLDTVAGALLQLYTARDQIKAQIYEITGLSDIIRGQSDASETATAQEIKGRFASLRLKKMQEDVARFAADVLRIKAQIICKQFQPQTILLMSGAEQMGEPPEIVFAALQLLKQDELRGFRVEITSDSMTQTDEEAEKRSCIEFLSAAGQFIEKAVQIATVAPPFMPLLGEMLMFAVRGFKVGRSIEGAFDQAMAQIMAPKPPPQPDPFMQEKIAVEREKLGTERMKVQIEQKNMQLDGELKQQEHVMRMREMQAKTQQIVLNNLTQPAKPTIEYEVSANG